MLSTPMLIPPHPLVYYGRRMKQTLDYRCLELSDGAEYVLMLQDDITIDRSLASVMDWIDRIYTSSHKNRVCVLSLSDVKQVSNRSLPVVLRFLGVATVCAAIAMSPPELISFPAHTTSGVCVSVVSIFGFNNVEERQPTGNGGKHGREGVPS